jgi:hypothetical protein
MSADGFVTLMLQGKLLLLTRNEYQQALKRGEGVIRNRKAHRERQAGEHGKTEKGKFPHSYIKRSA